MKLKHPFLPIVLTVVAALVISFVALPASARSLTQDPQCVGTDCPVPAPETPPVTPPTKDADVWKLFGLLAIVIQRLVDPLKQTWVGKPGEHTYDWLASVAFGILLALMFQLNIFAAAGLESNVKWAATASVVLTGYLMSFGANILNDFLARAQPAEAKK